MIGRAGSLATIRSYGDCGVFNASAFDRCETLDAARAGKPEVAP